MCTVLGGGLIWAAPGLAADTQAVYSYDQAGRLVEVDYGQGKKVVYQYDKAGNLLKRRVTGSPSPESPPSPPPPGKASKK